MENVKKIEIPILEESSLDAKYIYDRDVNAYCRYAVLSTMAILNTMKKEEEKRIKKDIFGIKNVIFNNPATIVFWNDDTKTVVKCQKGEKYDPEKGLAMAICKRALGTNESNSNFNNVFKKWLPKEETEDNYQKSKEILEQVLGTNVYLIQEIVDAMLDTTEKENE